MSTSYEWRYNHCSHCDRHDVAHVCISGRIWHGYRNILFNTEHPDWGWEEYSPFPFEIRSLGDWRRVFTEVPGELWDEYGQRHDDALEWLDVVKPNVFPGPPDINGWFDNDGYYFSAGGYW